tara:strand:- start:1644 stop:2081 length:438 start_codon:yes stop_codon:yes gene_type:complete
MATMREVVEDALEDITVKKAEVTLTNDELQSGIRRLNDMLAQWNELGIIAGYNPVTNGDDTLELEPAAIAAAKAKLAIRLAPSFSKIVTPALVENARETMEMLETANSHIGEIAYPDTLPTGSGNDCNSYDAGDRFFNQNKTENF